MKLNKEVYLSNTNPECNVVGFFSFQLIFQQAIFTNFYILLRFKVREYNSHKFDCILLFIILFKNYIYLSNCILQWIIIIKRYIMFAVICKIIIFFSLWVNFVRKYFDIGNRLYIYLLLFITNYNLQESYGNLNIYVLLCAVI